ncbi:hypothetical protein B296_00050711 [Ensete ventricosum]|uniref:Auxin response factor domain-containing protein n=1 Tax=Ensete ventricosum TaxID=4639 RepID=A0A426YK58_ENSVE|nr:hypothetical protein B296_00050711 [Ensete ventricosum]
MASSEVSVKGSSVGGGQSLSSGCSEPHEGAPVRGADAEGSMEYSGGAVSGKDSDDALYTELWLACAGPLVTIPRFGERVFYFPQGHIEQVEASTNQVADQQMPVYNLPWKIPYFAFVDYLIGDQDMSRQPPSQELVAKDLHRVEWRFRHIFRGNILS